MVASTAAAMAPDGSIRARLPEEVVDAVEAVEARLELLLLAETVLDETNEENSDLKR